MWKARRFLLALIIASDSSQPISFHGDLNLSSSCPGSRIWSTFSFVIRPTFAITGKGYQN
jgi:hypothetical protein